MQKPPSPLASRNMRVPMSLRLSAHAKPPSILTHPPGSPTLCTVSAERATLWAIARLCWVTLCAVGACKGDACGDLSAAPVPLCPHYDQLMSSQSWSVSSAQASISTNNQPFTCSLQQGAAPERSTALSAHLPWVPREGASAHSPPPPATRETSRHQTSSKQ